MKGQAPLWANLKHHFYDDLPKLFRQSGPWDLLIFSGDIVQKGSREEYLIATDTLKELYSKLAELRCCPQFLAVPGNHDLVRPAENDMATMLLQDWHSKPNVRESFLQEQNGSYRGTVRQAFGNYQQWYDGLSKEGIPVVEAAHGFLPGDQVATIKKPEGQMGIVGLNSSWLQLGTHNKAGDLHVDHTQLSTMLPDAEGWCRANQFNLLVTHQPVEWLAEESRNTWKNEIAPPGRFDLHLFGHMHQPISSSLTTMGSSPVTVFQAPSLFGQEYLPDGKTERIHGYSAGMLTQDGGKRELRIWPRTFTRTRSGQGRMTPNTEFILPDDSSTALPLPDKLVMTSETATVASSVSSAPAEPARQAFEASETADGEKLLLRFRHYLLPPGAHSSVRKVERDAAAKALERRGLWIVADWGLSSDEFLSTVLEARGLSEAAVFRLDLNEVPVNGDDLDQEIEAKIGIKVQQVSEALAAAGNVVLLFDDIMLGERPPGAQLREIELENLALAMLDYCPRLIIVMRTRSEPAHKQFDEVQIAALDEADLRSYVTNHADGGNGLAGHEEIGHLLAITGGVPDRIDHALNSLKVVTLSELVASHQEGTESELGVGSHALVRTIEELGDDTHPVLQRALQMLQVLATFPHGAQFDHIRRFNGVHGFYPDNATELLSRALIVTSTLPGLEQQSQAEAKKILSVPRTVRDVVRSLMSDDVLNQHNRRAAELYFGSNWRAGSTSWPPERKYSSPKCSHHEISNASAILQRLLKAAMQDGDREELGTLMHLAAAYSDALMSGSHYYGAASFCAAFLHTAPAGIADDMVARVRLQYGRSLRMIGERPKAVEILEGLDPDSFDKDDRESLLMSLALAYKAAKDPRAVEVANRLLKSKDVSTKIQANAILIESEPPSEQRRQKLIDLEREARRKKHHSVANNIALNIASDTDEPEVARRYLNEVTAPRKDHNDIYNFVRATVELAERTLDSEERLGDADQIGLIASYQYLFIQRIPSLFDRCHRVLWACFLQKGDVANLFALFRHSSFIWRVRGVGEKDQGYLASLTRLSHGEAGKQPLARDKEYFLARSQTAQQEPAAIESAGSGEEPRSQ